MPDPKRFKFANSSSNIVPFVSGSKDSLGAVAPCVEEAPNYDGLPAEFLVREEGIYQRRCSSAGDEVLVLICSPMIVQGTCRQTDGNRWGRVVDVLDPDGNTHRHIIDEAELSNGPAALVRPLRALGLVVEASNKADQSVAKLIRSWRPSHRFTRVEVLGWTDSKFKAFTLGSGEVIGDESVVFQKQICSVGAAMTTCGSLDEWRRNVADRCNGNPLMVLAVSHAFTGPLLSPLAMDGGGFHLRGASSRGKSTLLGVAASVWGAPQLVQSWRGTDNGIEALASACSSTLLVLDELYQIAPQVAGDVVYMLSNGRGKARAQSTGKVQPGARWHVPLLSSGEISLEEHMASGGKRIHIGQETRLLDITADSRRFGSFDCLHGLTEGQLFAEQLHREVLRAHGTAGPEFVRRLMQKTNKIASLNRFVDGFCDHASRVVDLPPDGQVQRALRRFAVAALAGEMATKFQITGWAPGVAFRGVLEVFNTWFEERDKATRSEINESIDRTRSYIKSNRSRFMELGKSHAKALDGWRDADWFYFLPTAWRSIHSNAIEAANNHKSAGYLRTQKNGGLQFRMGRNVDGRPKTYAVNASLFED